MCNLVVQGGILGELLGPLFHVLISFEPGLKHEEGMVEVAWPWECFFTLNWLPSRADQHSWSHITSTCRAVLTLVLSARSWIISQVLVEPPQQSLQPWNPSECGCCMHDSTQVFVQTSCELTQIYSELSFICTASSNFWSLHIKWEQFSVRWALGERSGLCKAYMHGITHMSRVWVWSHW